MRFCLSLWLGNRLFALIAAIWENEATGAAPLYTILSSSVLLRCKDKKKDKDKDKDINKDKDKSKDKATLDISSVAQYSHPQKLTIFFYALNILIAPI